MGCNKSSGEEKTLEEAFDEIESLKDAIVYLVILLIFLIFLVSFFKPF